MSIEFTYIYAMPLRAKRIIRRKKKRRKGFLCGASATESRCIHGRLAVTHQLTFASLYNYPTEAILLPLALRHGERIARADAHVDPGSTFRVFKRQLGEAVDLKIEAGDPLGLTTVTGTFQ